MTLKNLPINLGNEKHFVERKGDYCLVYNMAPINKKIRAAMMLIKTTVSSATSATATTTTISSSLSSSNKPSASSTSTSSSSSSYNSHRHYRHRIFDDSKDYQDYSSDSNQAVILPKSDSSTSAKDNHANVNRLRSSPITLSSSSNNQHHPHFPMDIDALQLSRHFHSSNSSNNQRSSSSSYPSSSSPLHHHQSRSHHQSNYNQNNLTLSPRSNSNHSSSPSPLHILHEQSRSVLMDGSAGCTLGPSESGLDSVSGPLNGSALLNSECSDGGGAGGSNSCCGTASGGGNCSGCDGCGGSEAGDIGPGSSPSLGLSALSSLMSAGSSGLRLGRSVGDRDQDRDRGDCCSSPMSDRGGRSHNSTSSSKMGKIFLDKTSEEYRLRRERNNIAVRKSRSKSKMKFVQTMERMTQLEEENKKLHRRIESMDQELAILKYLLSKYASDSQRGMISLEDTQPGSLGRSVANYLKT